MSTGKQNFNALTGLRFFAAMGVVLYHFAGPIMARGPQIPANLVASGFVAVSFFYILSGFVLSYSYVDRQGTLRGSRRSFWVARVARIYPAYLLAFVLAAPYNIAWSLRVNHLGTGIAKLLTGAACVLTLQQAWTPWTAWYWNYPAWSVSVEAFFYLVFPLLVPLLRRFRTRSCVLAMIALWLIAMGTPAWLCLVHGFRPGPPDHLQMAVEFNPILRLPEFLIGVLLGRLYILGFRIPRATSRVLSYLSLVALIVCFACGPFIPRPLLANGLLAPLFGLLIYSLAEGVGSLARLLSLPLLVLFGEASYGIYILQIPISYVLGVPPPQTSALTFAGYLAVLMIASLISWRYLESPLRTRIRRWLSPAAPRSQNTRVLDLALHAPALQYKD